MNEITIRLMESLIVMFYFMLSVTTVLIAMKFIGKYFTKIANICIISAPIVGILGGWAEWIINGKYTSGSTTLTFAENLAVFAIVMYVLAFLSYMFFDQVNQKEFKKAI